MSNYMDHAATETAYRVMANKIFEQKKQEFDDYVAGVKADLSSATATSGGYDHAASVRMQCVSLAVGAAGKITKGADVGDIADCLAQYVLTGNKPGEA